MNNALLLNLGIILFGVLIGALSQILLKKAAMKTYPRWIDQYLNPTVIFAYAVFMLSSLCSTIGFRVVPLSWSPIWSAAAHLFVAVFAYFMMKERPGRRKCIGLAVIVAGILLFLL